MARKRCHSVIDDSAGHAELLDTPPTCAERLWLFQRWADPAHIRRGQYGSMLQHAYDKLANGVQCSSDCSGAGGFEECIRILRHQWRAGGIDLGKDIVVARSGDINRTCQYVLANTRVDGAADTRPCLFGDMLSRMPDLVKEQLVDLQSVAQECAGDYQTADKHNISRDLCIDVRAILRNCMSQLRLDTIANCLAHNTDCPVFQQRVDGKVRVDVIGTCCQPFSIVNQKRAGLLDERCLVFFQWVLERYVSLEDIFILECTVGFWAEGLQLLFAGLYDVKFVYLSPTDNDVPAERNRLYAVGIKCDSWRWGIGFTKPNILALSDSGEKSHQRGSISYRMDDSDEVQAG